jgi:hypothetical protein
MRFLLMAFAIFYTMPSFAALDEKCQETAQNYLIRGNLGTPFGGDRLWSLERLNRDFQKDKAAECIENIRTSAIADAREYWSGYISVKYSCNGEDSLKLPDEKPEKCPDEKWAALKENVAYIDAIESGKVAAAESAAKVPKVATKPKAAAACEQPKSCFTPLADISAAVANQPKKGPDDPCAKFNIDPKDLQSKTPVSPGSKEFEGLKSCIAGRDQFYKDHGLDKPVSGLIDSIKASYGKMVQYIQDEGYRASVKAAISDLITLLNTDAAVAGKAIWDAIVSEVNETMVARERFQCLNANAGVKEICQQVIQKGLPTLLGMGAIRKIVAMLKAGKKITTGAVVVRDAAQATTAAEATAIANTQTAVISGQLAAPAAKTATSTAPKLLAGPAKSTGAGAAETTAGTGAGSTAGSAAGSAAGTAGAGTAETVSKGTQAARDSRARASAIAKRQKEEKAKAEAEAQRNRINPKKDAAEIDRISNARIYDYDDMKTALNLPKNATVDDIQKKIQQLQKKYHPQYNPDRQEVSGKVTEQLAKMRQRIKEMNIERNERGD